MLGDNLATLGPKERARRLVQIDSRPRIQRRSANLTLDAKAGPIATRVSRTLDVQPLGFPRESSTGGMLESNGRKSFEFTLPAEIVRGSVPRASRCIPLRLPA